MTMTHLETVNTSTHPRKSQRVYRSPSHLDDPSPFSKQTEKKEEQAELMEMNADDKEASTILMALSQHANRILSEKKSSTSKSMSITNLLDNEASTKESLPEPRRNSFVKKGFQVCLTQRKLSVDKDGRSFRHPSSIRVSNQSMKSPQTTKFKRSAMHVHISYRIHAYQNSMLSRSISKFKAPVSKSTHSYQSAFRPAYSTSSPTTSSNSQHHRHWNQNPSLSSY